MTNGIPHPLPPYTGPSFQGFEWCLQGTQNKDYHLLKISTQVAAPDLKADITGSWGPATNKCVANGATKAVTGQIFQAPGNITSFKISFIWSPNWNPPDPANFQQNTLTGVITFVPGRVGVRGEFFLPEWVLQGTVVVTDNNFNVIPGAGPGNLVGAVVIGGPGTII